jgi:hypothetical protein
MSFVRNWRPGRANGTTIWRHSGAVTHLYIV